MYSAAQLSLYPMTDGFVGVILDAIGVLERYRPHLRTETDDLSTLIVAPPETLYPAMRDLFVAAAASGRHVTLSATVSRGCPGATDDPICGSDIATGPLPPLAGRITEAIAETRAAPITGIEIAAQFALYVPGSDSHSAEIAGCIEFLQGSGLRTTPKSLVTRIDGDAGPVFSTLGSAFWRFGHGSAHVVMDLTVSANSPSRR
ncbi:HMP/thiamine-binding protein [Arsenicitalea aurantiaca]|uniref:HMP/thiamine-binding protein n=1 Tax=Arsenicitalea aurantiaca TaxID=1783274 RepID=A0A433XBB8_9HYPH|nr:YkoF family thiamine/hydroxymethylpyrimidine-binding protein [Arsenicitalea aurantiaca]RUT31366.1 HMP/thiamine-binding protein [Arsenicitalea aurantiaca]